MSDAILREFMRCADDPPHEGSTWSLDTDAMAAEIARLRALTAPAGDEPMGLALARRIAAGDPVAEASPTARSMYQEMVDYADRLRVERDALVHALDEALVTSGELGIFRCGDDPKQAINTLCAWAQGVGAHFEAEKRRAVEHERDALLPVARLGLWALDQVREYALDVSGGDLEELALKEGLLDAIDANDVCGMRPCAARSVGDPHECYRETPGTLEARRIIEEAT